MPLTTKCMFTGIIENIGSVLNAEFRDGQCNVLVATGYKDLVLGESIAVNGICLTVAEANDKGDAQFFISEETLARTNFSKLQTGSKLNLERAMQPLARMGGHYVQGHVDGLAAITQIETGDEHHKLSISLPPSLARYCVEKGSIAVNGVSLTINKILSDKQEKFMISLLLIPHTWKHTNFSELHEGDAVNIEVDILAKYVERLCPQYLQQPLNS